VDHIHPEIVLIYRIVVDLLINGIDLPGSMDESLIRLEVEYPLRCSFRGGRSLTTLARFVGRSNDCSSRIVRFRRVFCAPVALVSSPETEIVALFFP
jgi:hypothetical protein